MIEDNEMPGYAEPTVWDPDNPSGPAPPSPEMTQKAIDGSWAEALLRRQEAVGTRVHDDGLDDLRSRADREATPEEDDWSIAGHDTGTGQPDCDDVGHRREVAGRVSWVEMLTSDAPEPEWLVEPVIPAGRATSIISQAKAGKSLLLLELCVAVATGRPFLGQPSGPPRKVLYVDYEMTVDDLRERVADMGVSVDGAALLDANLFYYLLPDLAPLDTHPGAVELVNLARNLGAALVTIDTFGRAVEGDENSADTTRAYYRLTGRALKAAGIATVRSDHIGKDADRGSRGSSAKAEDIDVEWLLTATDDGVHLKRRNSRVPWVPDTVTIQRVEDPPLHRLVTSGSPAGTRAIVDLLEELKIHPDLGERKAREAIKTAGRDAPRAVVLRAGIQFRRQRNEAEK